MKPVTAPGYSLRQILRNRIPGEKGCDHCSGFGILRTITLPPVTQALSDLTAHLPTVFSDLNPHHFDGRGEGSSVLLLLKMSLTLASRRGGGLGRWGKTQREQFEESPGRALLQAALWKCLECFRESYKGCFTVTPPLLSGAPEIRILSPRGRATA